MNLRKNFLAFITCILVIGVGSCTYESPEINFRQTTVNDYSKIIEALENQTKTMAEKLALLEAALKDQSMTISMKLELLTKAYEEGVLKYEEMADKTIDALNALKASNEERLAAIEAAMKNQSVDLSAKLALIEASMKSGFTDVTGSQKLLSEAVASLTGTVAEKLSAIETAVKNQSVDLSAKLALIEASMKSGFADVTDSQKLMNDAVASLTGTVAEKLSAIETAVKNQSVDLSAKLVLIEASMKSGFADVADSQKLMNDAVASLTGTVAEKLSAIETAIKNQTADFGPKIGLIKSALDAGFLDQKNALGLIKDALETLNGTVEGVDDIISDIVGSINKVKNAIDGVDNTIKDKINASLDKIFSAVAGIVIPDYESLLQSIKSAIEELKNSTPTEPGKINGHPYVEMGDGLKWATYNVGASKPEESGNYFAWGETEPKTSYNWANYQFASKGTLESIFKYTIPDGYEDGSWYDDYNKNFLGDNLTQLVPADDAAHVNWKGSWRMPTMEEWSALYNTDNFKWTYVENYRGTGVAGMMVTSKIEGYEGNSIFLPGPGAYIREGYGVMNVGSGYYWSSSLFRNTYSWVGQSVQTTSLAYNFGFWSILAGRPIAPRKEAYADRYRGHCVRAVSE